MTLGKQSIGIVLLDAADNVAVATHALSRGQEVDEILSGARGARRAVVNGE